jgi:hypothetical protein
MRLMRLKKRGRKGGMTSNCNDESPDALPGHSKITMLMPFNVVARDGKTASPHCPKGAAPGTNDRRRRWNNGWYFDCLCMPSLLPFRLLRLLIDPQHFFELSYCGEETAVSKSRIVMVRWDLEPLPSPTNDRSVGWCWLGIVSDKGLDGCDSAWVDAILYVLACFSRNFLIWNA